MATYPESIIRFYASDMILSVDLDAAYLVLPKAKSRIAGFYYLTDRDLSYYNSPILVVCKTLKNVVASAAEAETGGLFLNGQEIVNLRHILISLNHPQPPTPLKTDNTTSTGFVHSNIKMKKSKAWDMRFHWLREKMAHEHLRIYWQPGSTNYADYYTKHHPTIYHKKMREIMYRLQTAIHAYKRKLARVC